MSFYAQHRYILHELFHPNNMNKTPMISCYNDRFILFFCNKAKNKDVMRTFLKKGFFSNEILAFLGPFSFYK